MRCVPVVQQHSLRAGDRTRASPDGGPEDILQLSLRAGDQGWPYVGAAPKHIHPLISGGVDSRSRRRDEERSRTRDAISLSLRGSAASDGQILSDGKDFGRPAAALTATRVASRTIRRSLGAWPQ